MISAVGSGTTCTITPNLSTTVSAKSVAFSSADSTAAFQAALDALPGSNVGGAAFARSGGELVVPTGSYLITSPVTFGGGGGLKMTGAGGYSWVTRTGTVNRGGARLVSCGNDILFFNNPGVGPQLESLNFADISVTANGSGQQGTGIGVHLLRSARWVIVNCSFMSLGVGIKVDGTDGGDSSWGKIDHCLFTSNGIGIQGTGQAYAGVDGGGGTFIVDGGMFQVYGTQRGIYVQDSNNYHKYYGYKMDMFDSATGLEIGGGRNISVVGAVYEHHGSHVGTSIYVSGRANCGNISIVGCNIGGGGSAGTGIRVEGQTLVIPTAVTTNASTTVTAAAGPFTPAHEGHTVTGTGIPAGTTITTVTSATQIVLSAAATASGTVAITLNQVVDSVHISATTITNHDWSLVFGNNAAGCIAQGIACRNWSNFAVTFEAALTGGAPARDCIVDGISLSGGQTIETAVSFNGSENDVMNLVAPAKRQARRITVGLPADQGRPGDIRVDTGKTWISDALRNWQEYRPYDSSVPVILTGSGTPVAVVSAPPGTIYLDTAAATSGQLLYIKKTGLSTSGWKKMTDVESDLVALRLGISGTLTSGADQNGDFVIACPFPFTAMKMTTISKTAVSTAMTVQLRTSGNSGGSYTDLAGFLTTYPSSGKLQTVDPADQSVGDGDWLAVSLGSASGSALSVSVIGVRR
jgi:hypothetical protein